MGDCFRFGVSGDQCCDVICNYFNDDFNRTNNTNVGTDWTERVLDWSINGNSIRATGNNGILLNNNNATGSTGNVLICSDVLSGNGTRARHIVNYVDDNNYNYGEWRPGVFGGVDGTLAVGKVVAGVDTVLRSSTLPQVNFTGLTTCLTQYGQLRAYGQANIVTPSCAIPINAINNAPSWNIGKANVVSNKWGIGTGNPGGTAILDNVHAYLNDIESDVCPICWRHCLGCIDRASPARVQVQLSGLNAGSCATQCSRRDGTYICTNTPAVGAPAGGVVTNFYCRYGVTSANLTPPSAVGCVLTGTTLDVGIGNSSTPGIFQIQVDVVVPGSGGSSTIRFKKTYPSAFDCMNLVNENIPFDSNIGTAVCSGVSATCLVTSLDP